MKIRMLAHISGGRGDGTEWPNAGEVLEVGDEEGAQLCAARLAVPVAEEPEAEKAVMPDDAEKRTAPARKPKSAT